MNIKLIAFQEILKNYLTIITRILQKQYQN